MLLKRSVKNKDKQNYTIFVIYMKQGGVDTPFFLNFA